MSPAGERAAPPSSSGRRRRSADGRGLEGRLAALLVDREAHAGGAVAGHDGLLVLAEGRGELVVGEVRGRLAAAALEGDELVVDLAEVGLLEGAVRVAGGGEQLLGDRGDHSGAVVVVFLVGEGEVRGGGLRGPRSGRQRRQGGRGAGRRGRRRGGRRRGG